MPRDIISRSARREGPKREISTVIEKHNRLFSPVKVVERKRAPHAKLVQKDFQMAKDALAALNDASAVEYMQALPLGLQEMFMLAEEVGKARPMILRSFPKPGHRAREKYLPSKKPRTRAKTEQPSAVGAEAVTTGA